MRQINLVLWITVHLPICHPNPVVIKQLCRGRQAEPACGASRWSEHNKGPSVAPTGLSLIWEYTESLALTVYVSSRSRACRSDHAGFGKKKKEKRSGSLTFPRRARVRKTGVTKQSKKDTWHLWGFNEERLNWRGTVEKSGAFQTSGRAVKVEHGATTSKPLREQKWNRCPASIQQNKIRLLSLRG